MIRLIPTTPQLQKKKEKQNRQKFVSFITCHGLKDSTNYGSGGGGGDAVRISVRSGDERTLHTSTRRVH